MLQRTKWRWVRMAALAAVVSLALGSLAWGYDDDDRYRQDQARERGYQNGYNDGQRTGHFDRERGHRFHFKNDQWEDGRDGYEHWMGSFGHYKKAYRNGYADGYKRAFNSYGDRDDYRRHQHDDWH